MGPATGGRALIASDERPGVVLIAFGVSQEAAAGAASAAAGSPIAAPLLDPVVVTDGRAGNDVVARAEAAGASHLVALPVAREGPAGQSDGDDDHGEGPAGQGDGDGALASVAEAGSVIDRVIAARFGGDQPVGLLVRPAMLIVDVQAVVTVGGFDVDEPGLGWVELVERLVAAGWTVDGVDPDEAPSAPALAIGLDAADRIAVEGRWLRRRAGGLGGRLRLERHRRRALRLVARGQLPPPLLERIEAGARTRWRGAAPHEAQTGVGWRADWRHLLADAALGPRSAVAIVGLGPADRWRWLVDDGWAASVGVELPPSTEAGVEAGHRSGSPDVVVIGPDDHHAIERAAVALAGRGSLVVLVAGRRRSGHRATVAAARAQGLTDVRRWLALPDVAAPKRLVPLDHPGGLAWLMGSDPPLRAARLPRSRRALRALVGPIVGRRPELVGGVVVVAAPPGTPGPDPAVVLTSGFDEGSRTVVLPFGDDDRPRRVVKLTSRPGYRANAEWEHELLGELSQRLRPGLVPVPLDRIDDGRHHAVVESYAGRWTVADILNEQRALAARVELLDVAIDTVTELARTPPPGGPSAETWNEFGFDELIGRWFDQLDRVEGPSPARASLRRALAHRSDALVGQRLPIGLRHFDLGPWNLVVADRPGDGPITAVDWELAPPRQAARGPAGADHLYLVKYWLHIAAGCRSVDDEQAAFAFLADPVATGSAPARVGGRRSGPVAVWARQAARAAVARSVAAVDLPTPFLPLIEAHVWAEAACATAARRRGRGGDGGSPARYLDTIARHRSQLLATWPL